MAWRWENVVPLADPENKYKEPPENSGDPDRESFFVPCSADKEHRAMVIQAAIIAVMIIILAVGKWLGL